MSPAQKGQLQEIVSLFDRAEQRVKEVERLDGELSIPSINQLRYVGYHLVRALSCSEEVQEFNTQLTKAENHVKRAIYDAHEIGIIYLLESIKNFKTRNAERSSVTIEVVSSYVDDLASASEAASFIDGVKKDHPEDREAFYENSEPHYTRLREIENKFTVAEPLITKKFQEKLDIDKKETRQFILKFTLSLLAIAVTVFGILVNLPS